jgi:hypothetical protein
VNYLTDWLTTDGTKIVVDTSKAPASTIVYEVKTYYWLWCACSSNIYTYYVEGFASFYFQIKTTPLISVITEQFSSTYTFYVGIDDFIDFPAFTTVPLPTGDSYTKISLTVNGILQVNNATLSWSSTTFNSLPCLYIYPTYFDIYQPTLSDVGMYTFDV